ncbi:Vps62-related protein [Pseudomonas sp. Marseille-Q5117]|uniref:Vps62-related protein n=1 Tax=Pseudomonas sp. Marseille-Q5117 TaxID=2972777 RepID=UPI0021C85771|nr:Vps62-related protein [Pseudomonas sp. Marseille-Q5117]
MSRFQLSGVPMTNNPPIIPPTGRSEPIRIDNLLINFTTEFLRIWDTDGLSAKSASFWRPTPAPDALPGYFPLGDVVTRGLGNINDERVVAVVCEADIASTDPTKGRALRRPDDYELIWKDSGSGSKRDLSIWRPLPPAGYVALGSVCSNDHEKPSLNAVRCVRADLVIGSNSSDLIWDDKGSKARQRVSTWSAVPPTALPGEIYLASGSFFGLGDYTRPASFPVYCLRLQIGLQMHTRPSPPVLCGETPTPLDTVDDPSYIAILPWFTVKDPRYIATEQLRHSPFYLLQRQDQYVLVGHARNDGNDSQIFKWTAPRAQRTAGLRTFTHTTSVEFGAQWQNNQHNAPMFSARLGHDFTQCEIHSNDWLNTASIEVVAVVDKNRSVASYLVQSDYTLLRADGTSVTEGFSYTDGGSLHISQYAQAKPEIIAVSEPEPVEEQTVQSSLTQDEISAAQAMPDQPSATDSAP